MELTLEQREIQKAVAMMAERVRPVDGDGGQGLLRELAAAGFLDIIESGGTPLDAVILVEQAARSAGPLPLAARILVAPALGIEDLPSVVTLLAPSRSDLARYASAAGLVVVLDEDQDRVLVCDTTDAEITEVRTRWGGQLGRVKLGADVQHPIDRPATALLNLWRIALAAETAGLVQGALDKAVSHVQARSQFGRPIGAFQAVQHKLARVHLLCQGSSWLARRAAWDVDDDVAAAAAASYAIEGIAEVVTSVHQVCGAIGLTDEFGLGTYTGGLTMLRSELGGRSAHAHALGRARLNSIRRSRVEA